MNEIQIQIRIKNWNYLQILILTQFIMSTKQNWCDKNTATESLKIKN